MSYRMRRPPSTVLVPRLGCKIEPAAKLRVSVLKAVAKRYILTAGQWIIFSQALERFLQQDRFRQYPNIK